MCVFIHYVCKLYACFEVNGHFMFLLNRIDYAIIVIKDTCMKVGYNQ